MEEKGQDVVGTFEYTNNDGTHGSVDLRDGALADAIDGVRIIGRYVTGTHMRNGVLRIDVDLTSLPAEADFFQHNLFMTRRSFYMMRGSVGKAGWADIRPKCSFALLLPEEATEADNLAGSQLYAVKANGEPRPTGDGVEFEELSEGTQSIAGLGTLWKMSWTDGTPVTFRDLQDGILFAVAAAKVVREGIEAGRRKARLPRQDTRRPTRHVQTLSKVSTGISEVENGETVRFDMSGKNETPVYTALSLNYEGEDISLSKPIDSYDESVHNAVATLWAAGNRTITPMQVARVLTGKDKPGAGSIGDVTASMDKQRRTFVAIDFSAELRGRTGELDGEIFTADQCKTETYMLDATKTTVKTARGNEVSGYTINSVPILYLHDRMTGQLTSYPQSLLKATGEAVSSTQTNITMRDYIIARISRMRNAHTTTSRNIVYDTVFEHIGRGSASAKERRRMIESARSILDALKAEGFIAGWSEYAERGSSHRTKGVAIKTGGRK